MGVIVMRRQLYPGGRVTGVCVGVVLGAVRANYHWRLHTGQVLRGLRYGVRDKLVWLLQVAGGEGGNRGREACAMVSKLREGSFLLHDCIGKVIRVPIQVEVGVKHDVRGRMGATQRFRSTSCKELTFVGDVCGTVSSLPCGQCI